MNSTSQDQSIPIASFLWQRIRQLGVQSVMGVPGDMNLELLDYINDVPGLTWVGNANELNAAYAADGYCRVKGCPGVVVTTMGVGELSALNGIAGAFTEHVKLVHIVGTTPTKAQQARSMIHHCLGPQPDHRVYSKISSHTRAAHCWVDDAATATEQIDNVLRECYVESLPVYIFVPMDFVHTRVPAAALDTPVNLKPYADNSACLSAVEAVMSRLKAAKAPVAIVDALTARFQAEEVVRQLLERLKIPTFSTPMGKSIIDESRAYFYGVYNGQVSHPGVAESIEVGSDLVIDLGPCLSDSNTGGHSRNIKKENYISIEADRVVVGHSVFPDVPIVYFLKRLIEQLENYRLEWNNTLKLPVPAPPADLNAKNITQSWIWTRIGQMLCPGDILIGESGTAQFGLSDATFPSDIKYLTQIYFGSIGFSVPACLGAAMAQSELGKRGQTILVVGDGSLQLTVQEIGTMIKRGLRNIIIIVINNGGYTIERAIHGENEGYNDIATWNHTLLLSAFGMKDGQVNSRQVDTKLAFEEVITSSAYRNLDSIQLLEVHMGVMDVPWRLQAQIDLINSRQQRLPSEKL